MLQRSKTRSKPYQTLTRKSRLKRVGKKGKERLKHGQVMNAQAKQEGWYGKCEVGPILIERGLTAEGCFGDWTKAHSVKTHRRFGRPDLEKECAGGCEFHHYLILDTLPPNTTCSVVREAIRRRIA